MSVFRWPWNRDRQTDDLADEFRAHIEMAAADRVARGEAPWEARAAARREFGNPGLVQEISRDQWGRAGVWLERLVQDVRFALRMLRRAPGFTTVSILTIALGIGATTAIFSVVDATLLHPLPFPHAEQLVRIEDDFAGVETDEAVDDIHEGRLAGPVLPQQRVDLTPIDGQVHRVVGSEAAEGLDDPSELERSISYPVYPV